MASTCLGTPVPLEGIKHDVYVSFRGKDTERGFTGHLRAALTRNCIDAFLRDGDEGEGNWGFLSGKISESLVSVVIFSENYADSQLCLEELVSIMECRGSMGQTVLPVFLGVEPTHVRKQTGAFGDGFTGLMLGLQSQDKVDIWSRALVEAADLSGWDSKHTSQDKIVDELVNRVEQILDQTSSRDQSDGFVGISRVEKVESLVCLTSSEKVHSVGIWGMGGIGKTTIARLLFYRLRNKFDGGCFVGNVRAKAERDGIDSVRKDMILQLLGVKTDIAGPYMFSPAICRKLGRKKLLIVLDDVDTSSQLKAMVGRKELYGPGSRIIVTSRDKQVLKNGCAMLYEVEKLNTREALVLFNLHSCKEDQPTSELTRLSKRAVSLAQGLPLAIEVLGCNLYGRNLEEWETELLKLEEIPDIEVTDILKSSYDGLADREKSLFLDVACIFQGWMRDRVQSIMDGCGFHAGIGLSRLFDKALITIPDSEGRLWMHDLLQKMGQDIVLHECIEEPRNRSRLWRFEEISNALMKNHETEGMSKIEVISLDLTTATNMELKSDVFKKMPGLRILFVRNDSSGNIRLAFPAGLDYLPDGLRSLRWDLYPMGSLPAQFNPDNLVQLHMVDNQLEQLWCGETEPSLPNLKYVNLSGSRNLTTLPSFSNALKLEKLLVPSCKSLKKIPDSIQHLVKLKDMDWSDNRSLIEFPEFSQLTRLEILSLMGCSKLSKIPQLPENLISLNLRFTRIKELPSSARRLSKLEVLMLGGCKHLKCLPSYISDLEHLQALDISGCRKLFSLPEKLGDLKYLDNIIINASPISSLPSSISRLSLLSRLYVQSSDLKSLPEDIKYLPNLKRMYLSDCKSLSFLPELPSSLQYMDASNCISLVRYTHRLLGDDDRRCCRAPEGLRLNFGNCFNLGRDARNKIWRDFWQRVQLILVSTLEKCKEQYTNLSESLSETRPRWSARLLCPGSEVPKSFKYSEPGCSLHVETNVMKTVNPLGYIFCVVVAFPSDFVQYPQPFTVTCMCLLEFGERFDSSCSHDFGNAPVQFQAEHMIMWFDHLSPTQSTITNVKFRLDIADMDDVKIVKCGVTPIGTTFGSMVLDEDNKCLEVDATGSLPRRSKRKNLGDHEEEEQSRHKR